MSELRSSEPSRASNFLSSRSGLEPKLATLLASLDPKTRQAIQALATAPADVRESVLASLDDRTRETLTVILNEIA
jgi:hypothetical protein